MTLVTAVGAHPAHAVVGVPEHREWMLGGGNQPAGP
jgi:hypothetical protein